MQPMSSRQINSAPANHRDGVLTIEFGPTNIFLDR